MKLPTLFLFFTFLVSCGGGGSGAADDVGTGGSGGGGTGGGGTGNSGITSGTITLSGSDTATVGTQLDTGFIGSSLAAAGQPDYIVIVNKSNTVTFEAPNILTPIISDVNNGFILVVTDADSISGIKGISMSILVNGTKLDYACTSPVSTFIECGTNAITLDIPNRTVTFTQLTVTNVNTSTVLTMDGELTW